MSNTLVNANVPPAIHKSEMTVKVGAVIIAAVGVAVAASVRSQMVQYWTFTPQDVARALTPLMLTALFIERTLEVFLTPWRGGDADELERQIAAAKSASTPNASVASSLEQKFLLYRSATRQIAFLAGLGLGTIISALGVRAMQPFFEPNAFQALPTLQQTLLTGIDVLVSGALLAGGASGLHQLVLVFTNFFEKTSDTIKKKA
jgi:hypothetical protein